MMAERLKRNGGSLPEAKDFSICALRIEDKCAQKKCLRDGLYFFNDRLCQTQDGGVKLNNSQVPHDFYGTNINIQAVVGQNGSGKSSILELLYRIINNFTFMLELGMHRNSSAEQLFYVKGLHATLYYLLDGNIGTLVADGDVMYFHYDSYEQHLQFEVLNNQGSSIVRTQELDINNEVVEEAAILTPLRKMAEVSRRFFYTIVTNYSMQSYNDQDYYDEKTYIEFFPNLKQGKGGKKLVSKVVVEREEGDVWIRSIFHKNDGYLSPIVLNPYRDEGIIDTYKEYRLSQYRLSTIFIQAEKKGIQVIDDYKLASIDYTYDPWAVEMKFKKLYLGKVPHDLEWIEFSNVASWHKAHKDSIAYLLLCELGLEQLDFTKKIIRDIALYMVYKVLSIASKYPSYYKYEDFGNLKSYFQGREDYSKRIHNLVDKIKKDKSHITIKLRQAENFINLIKCNVGLERVFNGTFTFDYYQKKLKEYGLIQKFPSNLRELTKILPPAVFSIDIKLKKDDENTISLSRMSSGERQLLYTCGTFIYHIINLLSVQDSNRVRYRNMMLVLDEVEICFHPEYQRQFISRLRNMLAKFRFNKYCSICIIIATHSPFILSDIPQQNILYLKDGQCVNDNVSINPYAANVNDILHQSFFLDKTFMGDYALERMQKLLSDIESYGKKKINRNIEDLKKEINLIGDKFLKQQLTALLTYKETLFNHGKNID
jgi:AAA15 family ATPase/GTPase